MTIVTPKFGMGASVLRLEDAAFITGKGRYTDDIAPAALLHGYVLRSPVAKARFRIGPLDAARAAPGVHLVLTGADLAHLGDLSSTVMQKQPDGTRAPTRDIPILCRDRVNYVGDAVAFVVADSRALAQDAAELIEVDYDHEEAAADTATALDDDSAAGLARTRLQPRLHLSSRRQGQGRCCLCQGRGTSRASNSSTTGSSATTWSRVRRSASGARRKAASCSPPARRACIPCAASWPARSSASTRPSCASSRPMSAAASAPRPSSTASIALVLEAARRLGRPVKWISDRTEHFLTDAQGRDNVVTAEMAMDKDGRFLGLRVELLANMGAYLSQYGPIIPHIGASMSTGVYDIQALDVSIPGVYTNTCPVDAYRGAGRPEAAFLVERLVDACARDLGLSVDEIRRRNFIRPEQFPYRTQTGRRLRRRRVRGPHEPVRWNAPTGRAFRTRRRRPRRGGKIRGIGMATYIEACAFAGSEPARVELNGDGTVTVFDRHADQRPGPCHRLRPVRVAEKLDLDYRQDHTSARATPTSWPRAAAPAARARSRSAASRPPAPARHLAEKIRQDRRRRAGGRRRRHRAGRRRGAHRRHRPVDRLCRASPSRGQKARRSQGVRRVRAGRGDLSQRHPHLRGRDRSGDRRDRDRRLHHRRRFRRHGESDPACRPGAWRRRAGHRPGAVGGHRL